MDTLDLGAELIRIGSNLRLGHTPQDAGVPDEVRLAMLLTAVQRDLHIPVQITQDTQSSRDQYGNEHLVAFNRKFIITLFPGSAVN